MKFSESWFREWINPQIDTSTLCNQLTEIGFEANIYNPIFLNDFHNIITGKIINELKVKKKNKLKYFNVDIGRNKSIIAYSILDDIYIGKTVAIATKKSVLTKKLTIKKILIAKNIYSEGKICTFLDLGIDSSKKEIIEISSQYPLGTDIKKIFSHFFPIINVLATPNRSYGLSLFTLAKEIAVINNLSLPFIKIKNTKKNQKNKININIEKNLQHVVKYCGKKIKNINLKKETPFWLKERLRFSEILPKKNILDNIINYVYIELGQPVHIINSSLIKNELFIRHPKKKEIKKLHAEKKIILSKTSIVVSNAKNILSLGNNLNENTFHMQKRSTNIFIGSIFLKPYSSFHNLNKNDIFSQNNYRIYEYSTDYGLQTKLINYTSSLIVNLCDGIEQSINLSHNNTIHYERIKINIQLKNFNKLLGCHIQKNVIFKILQKIGYEILQNDKTITVIVPNWRYDIKIEEHVIEDFLRIYGYKKIDYLPIKYHTYKSQKNCKKFNLHRIKYLLIDKGYYEVITYGFVDPNMQNLFFTNNNYLTIKNPISKELSTMRQSMWIGLLSSIEYNQNRQNHSLRFFESGICFIKENTKELKVKEIHVLSGAINGLFYPTNWDGKNRTYNFYDLKGDVESILELCVNMKKIEFLPAKITGLHAGKSAYIYINKTIIGKIGELDPRISKQFNLKNSTVLFELFLDKIKEKKTKVIHAISQYPTIQRDISIMLPMFTLSSNIIKTCIKIIDNNLTKIHITDVYYGNHIQKNKKSLTIKFIFQHYKKTYTNREIDTIINNCIHILEKKYKASLRQI
ncbi:Phenylalanine--tRNA ligase beta subunit [Buchnera aphidicola (Anoecia corni)]|uniref:Phenylalanine--tRNA ligase beta subunit n=1 Tax=Buchnera aphidicola (Anoecia corni) TaxID=2994477 RepID=A0AAT9IG41_9GAMM